MDINALFSQLNQKLPTAHVFLVGDEGTVVVYINKGVVERRVFCRGVNSPDIKTVKSILKENAIAPIYILVDVSDQSYVQHSLPAVSSLTVQRLAEKRLEKECAPDDLKMFYLLGRSKEGRKDWKFMFVSTPYKEPVTEWIDFIVGLPNPLSGVYLLPIEMQTLVRKLSKLFAPKEAKSCKWKFFISYNKVSGLRLLVLNDGKLIFTRSLPLADTIPDIVAGNIEQEAVNTLEYLRRLSFQDEEGLELIVMVSKEIKESLQSSKLHADNVILLTPFEVASALKLENAASATDKYSDTVVCASFLLGGKPVRVVSTPQTQKLTNINDFIKTLSYVCAGIVPLLLAMDLYYAWQLYGHYNEIKGLERDKRQVDNQWSHIRNVELKDFYQKEQSGEVRQMKELVKVYKDIMDIPEFPLLMLSKFATLKDANIAVQSFAWKTEKQIGHDSSAVVGSFELFVNNNQKNIQKLFADYDQFVRKVEVTFNEYDVNFTQLFDKISFDDKRENIPVKLEIKGPYPEKKRNK